MKYIGLDCHKQYDHATMSDTETGEIKAYATLALVINQQRYEGTIRSIPRISRRLLA